jgi:hypothetical protein
MRSEEDGSVLSLSFSLYLSFYTHTHTHTHMKTPNKTQDALFENGGRGRGTWNLTERVNFFSKYPVCMYRTLLALLMYASSKLK